MAINNCGGTVNNIYVPNSGGCGCGCGCGASGGSGGGGGGGILPPVKQPPVNPPIPPGSGSGGGGGAGDKMVVLPQCVLIEPPSTDYGQDGLLFVEYDLKTPLTAAIESTGKLPTGAVLVSAQLDFEGLCWAGVSVDLGVIDVSNQPVVLSVKDAIRSHNIYKETQSITLGQNVGPLGVGVSFTAWHYFEQGVPVVFSNEIHLNGELPTSLEAQAAKDNPPTERDPAWLKVKVCSFIYRTEDCPDPSALSGNFATLNDVSRTFQDVNNIEGAGSGMVALQSDYTVRFYLKQGDSVEIRYPTGFFSVGNDAYQLISLGTLDDANVFHQLTPEITVQGARTADGNTYYPTATDPYITIGPAPADGCYSIVWNGNTTGIQSIELRRIHPFVS